MRISVSRFSLIIWLLAGALLLSVALNVYYLAPRAGALAAWSTDDDAADDWDDEDDEDDAEPLKPSRAMLADELRRARLQLSRCQASQPAQDSAPQAARAGQHPHG